MEMEYSTYAQLVGSAPVDMPAPESFYPEINSGRQWNVEENPCQMAIQNSNGCCQQAPQTHANKPEGVYNSNQICSSRFQETSASAYRSMARERKRIKEMQSRNGLYSPMDDSVRNNSGDGRFGVNNNYSDCADRGINGPSQNGNYYW